MEDAQHLRVYSKPELLLVSVCVGFLVLPALYFSEGAVCLSSKLLVRYGGRCYQVSLIPFLLQVKQALPKDTVTTCS